MTYYRGETELDRELSKQQYNEAVRKFKEKMLNDRKEKVEQIAKHFRDVYQKSSGNKQKRLSSSRKHNLELSRAAKSNELRKLAKLKEMVNERGSENPSLLNPKFRIKIYLRK